MTYKNNISFTSLLTQWLAITILTFTVLSISSCGVGKNNNNQQDKNRPNEEIYVGFWFSCEFEQDSDECLILDDDGIELSSNGNIYPIENSEQGSLLECGRSPCFSSSLDSITVTRYQSVGKFSETNETLTLTFGNCKETISIPSIDPYLKMLNNCEVTFPNPKMKKYDGTIKAFDS